MQAFERPRVLDRSDAYRRLGRAGSACLYVTEDRHSVRVHLASEEHVPTMPNAARRAASAADAIDDCRSARSVSTASSPSRAC